MARATTLLLLLILTPLLAVSFACAPQQNGRQDPAASGSEPLPELSRKVIDDRINGARVYEVLPAEGIGEPIAWSFDEDEPKEIVVVDQKMDGPRATIILDIKTRSSPRANILRVLEGQIRTEWELETGFVLRRWEIVRTENISMKYKNLPKPTEQPANN